MSVIYDYNNDSVLGFYSDLKGHLTDQLYEGAGREDWGEVSRMAGLLENLVEWQGSTKLLVLSDNNGMGDTIKEYRGEE